MSLQTLSPQVCCSPPSPNIGWSYSWVNVSNNQNRPLYAQMVYDVGNSLALGQNGFLYADNTSGLINGAFTTIQVISACQFRGLTAINSFIGNLTSQQLPQGFTLNGPITNFQLSYGSVVAYKG